MPFLLTEQRRGWSLMIFLCSRNARPPKALVGRAQWKINQAPSLMKEPGERTSKLGRTIVSYSLQPCLGQGVSLGEVAWQRLLAGGGEGFNLG
jgi:hypothetical protein